jgi:hypothetical protein
MTHLTRLRDFIAAWSAVGQIQPIDAEVSWNPGIGAVTRRSFHNCVLTHRYRQGRASCRRRPRARLA